MKKCLSTATTPLCLGSIGEACSSWLRDGRGREIEKARIRKENGRKVSSFFPSTALFSRITRSYLRVPFTYASSLVSESQEQVTVAAVSMSCKVNFYRARSALQISMSLFLASPKWLAFSLLPAPAVRVPRTTGTR